MSCGASSSEKASVVVVESREQADALTAIGIRAATFRGIVDAPEPETMRYLDGRLAILYPTPASEGTALVTASRLGRLTIPVRVVSEQLDRARR